jgi:hypothetical protein
MLPNIVPDKGTSKNKQTNKIACSVRATSKPIPAIRIFLFTARICLFTRPVFGKRNFQHLLQNFNAYNIASLAVKSYLHIEELLSSKNWEYQWARLPSKATYR